MKDLKSPQRDPEAAFVRKAKAQRRVGVSAKCKCGETRPEALIRKSQQVICHECMRKQEGKTTMDNDHPAGKANNPTVLAVPVNDHRADLNLAQLDWPQPTLENPEGCPLLAGAGCIRGFIDRVSYLLKKLIMWIPEMLEQLSAFLKRKLGPKWWVGTELEKFAPKK
jgi:hypothetical protein